jgi:hypothetical protein
MNMMHIQNGTSRNGTSSKQDITKWHKLKMAHAQNGTRHKTTQAQTAHDIYIGMLWEIHR